jgi:hypothetical protein
MVKLSVLLSAWPTLSANVSGTYLEDNVADKVERESRQVLVTGNLQVGRKTVESSIRNFGAVSVDSRSWIASQLTIAAVEETKQIQQRNRR